MPATAICALPPAWWPAGIAPAARCWRKKALKRWDKFGKIKPFWT